MMQWIIKTWLCRAVDRLLRKQGAELAVKTIATWAVRLQALVGLLRGVVSKVEDGKLDTDEIDDVARDVERTIREW